MVFGAVLAGGTGTRMGFDKPKQFLMLGEKPISIHTVRSFYYARKWPRFLWGCAILIG